MELPRCDKCTFYDYDDMNCHRYPPQLVYEPKCSTHFGKFYSSFPEVAIYNWCGEFKEKEERNK